MWWDILPLLGHPENPAQARLDAAALNVLTRMLTVDSQPYQESALHGLGHWQHAYPAAVTALIDRYLARIPACRRTSAPTLAPPERAASNNKGGGW